MDVNITGVWQQNITGHGVTVAVIDDGTFASFFTISIHIFPSGDSGGGKSQPECLFSK